MENKAIEYFKDWSNYLLVTTVAILGWTAAAKDFTSTLIKGACIWSFALSVVFGIFTLALIPLIAEQRREIDLSFYDVPIKFQLIGFKFSKMRLKFVCRSMPYLSWTFCCLRRAFDLRPLTLSSHIMDIEAFLKDLKRAVLVRSYSELGRPNEIAIMPAVKKLKAEIGRQYEEQEKLSKKREQAVLDGGPQELLEHLDECSGDAVDNQIFLEQQMAVIAEIRLVYFYKSYEVDLKRILAGAYPDGLTNLYYRNQQRGFLLSKGIKLKKVTGYSETNELRILVNNIKHGTELDNEARAIPEFANSDPVTYQTGTAFYERVEPLVNTYIEELSQQVFNSLS